MNQNIGVNLSKVIDNLNKRVKVPAITQRQYYKEYCDSDDYIEYYKNEDVDEIIDDDKYSYLYEDDISEAEDNDSDEECLCGCCNNLDKKNIALFGIGALVGIMGLYILFKKKK